MTSLARYVLECLWGDEWIEIAAGYYASRRLAATDLPRSVAGLVRGRWRVRRRDRQ